jgi:hypothetical protein
MPRRALIALLGCLIVLAAQAIPAAAVGPFDAPVTVLEPGCNFHGQRGDAVVGGDGIIRGFIAFTGGDCDPTSPIWYFQGAGTRWTTIRSPYRGSVLGVAWDGSATYLLYAATDGVRITKRTGSEFTGGRRISHTGGLQGRFPTGDVVALGGNWWAVWAEPVPPGNEIRLFQALTIGRGHVHDGLRRRQVTFGDAGLSVMDTSPTLTLAPGSRASSGQALIAWAGTDGDATWTSFTRAGYDGRWRLPQTWSAALYAGSPDLVTYGPNVFGAYWFFDVDRSRLVAVTNPQATSPPRRITSMFRGTGRDPRIARSHGRTFVAWTTPRGQLMVGETTAPRAVSELNLTPAAGPQRLIAITARRGQATVLAVSPRTDRLWAATQR